MTFNIPAEGPQLTLNVINRVDDFKYLGAKMASTESDIANRKSLAWIAFWKLIKIWSPSHPVKAQTRYIPNGFTIYTTIWKRDLGTNKKVRK